MPARIPQENLRRGSAPLLPIFNYANGNTSLEILLRGWNDGNTTVSIANDLSLDRGMYNRQIPVEAINNFIRGAYSIRSTDSASTITSILHELETNFEREVVSLPIVDRSPGSVFHNVYIRHEEQIASPHVVTSRDIYHWQDYRRRQAREYGVARTALPAAAGVSQTAGNRPATARRSVRRRTAPATPPAAPVVAEAPSPPVPPVPPVAPPPSPGQTPTVDSVTLAILSAIRQNINTSTTAQQRVPPSPSRTSRTFRHVPGSTHHVRGVTPTISPALSPPEPITNPEMVPISPDTDYRRQLYHTLRTQLWTSFEFEREYNGDAGPSGETLAAGFGRVIGAPFVSYYDSHHLAPAFFRGITNPYDVAFVTTDSSVRGTGGVGIEINTYGTNANMAGKMAPISELMAIMREHDLEAGSTASIHCHLQMLQGVDLPKEIVFGMVELTRAYMPLILIASGTGGWKGPNVSGGTHRSSLGTYGDPIWVMDHMNTQGYASYAEWKNAVLTDVQITGSRNNPHYIGLNILQGTQPGENGGTHGLSVEFRFGDATDIPAQVAALSELYKAIVTRAAEYYLNTGRQFRADDLMPKSLKLAKKLLVDAYGAYDAEAKELVADMLSDLGSQMTPMAYAALQHIVAEPVWLMTHSTGSMTKRKAENYEKELEDIVTDQVKVTKRFIASFLDDKTLAADTEAGFYENLKTVMLEQHINEADIPTLSDIHNLGYHWDGPTGQLLYSPRMTGMNCPSCRREAAPVAPPAPAIPEGLRNNAA